MFGVVVALAAIYFAAARLGLTVATVGRSVTLIWPPTGIALAGLFLLGRRHWPGVALGAFLVNALTPGVPVLSALGMAAGNTLEALAGASALHWIGVEQPLGRMRDVLGLVGVAVVSPLLAAIIGVASLWLGGEVAASEVAVAWAQWWTGDMLGDLIVAPALLTWSSRAALKTVLPRAVEALASLTVTVGVTAITFSGASWLQQLLSPLPYLVFPGLLWMTLRFGPRGGSAASLAISVPAIVWTIAGRGPLLGATLGASLVQLDLFLVLTALIALFVGALVAERERALALREEFIALASHELRTPLTPLKLQLQLLRRTAGDPEQRRRLEQVDRQVERLVRLVEELLDSSRMASGNWSLRRERVDLGALAQDVVAGMETELSAAGCRVGVRVSGPVGGEWDPTRLQQVVTNLVTNAMKFGAGKPITVSVRGEGDQAELQVTDEGVGVPRREQQRIFEPFERSRQARDIAGLGLGLYVVRTVVEAHGGRVTVRSQPGHGATFTVRLPRSPPALDGAPPG
jgi:signal transduction histidine kinase